MTPATMTATPAHRGNWLRRSERWLDERGKPAWIVAMVLGFIFFWPVGLALLAYMIWSKPVHGRSAQKEAHRRDRRRSRARLIFPPAEPPLPRGSATGGPHPSPTRGAAKTLRQ